MIWSIIHTRSTNSVGWVTRWSWVLRIRDLFRSLSKDKRLCSGVTLSPWLLTLTKKGWKTWGGLDCVFTCLRVKVCNGLVPEACSRAVQCGNFEPSVWCQRVVVDPGKQAWESLYDFLGIYATFVFRHLCPNAHNLVLSVWESIHCPVDILIANLHKAVV